MNANKLNKSISIVIPVFNSEKTINRTLKSITAQTRLDYIKEVIIVNDGSTDTSGQIIERFISNEASIPIILVTQINKGASSARNAGIKKATGRWIALLDSDDEWRPNKLEVQMDIIDQYPDIDFLGCNVNDTELNILGHRIKNLHKATVKEICLKVFPATPTILFKKEITSKIGYFDESQRYAEDGNYFLKICNTFNYYHLPVSLVDIGCGKPSFGYSGLSANLKGMYLGNVKNIQELKNGTIISKKFYIFLRIFYWLKYMRRIIICKVRGLFNENNHK